MPRALLFVCLVALLMMTGTAAVEAALLTQDDEAEAEIIRVDLGQREQGDVRPIMLQAFNRNCENPQDFQFDVSQTSWLRIAGSNVVSQLGTGQTGAIEAIVDLNNVPPGPHVGTIVVDCITCGWFVFSTCEVDRQHIELQVEVTPLQQTAAAGASGPSGPQGQPGTPGPAPAPGDPDFGPAIVANPGITAPGVDGELGVAQTRELNTARRNSLNAAAAHRAAIARANTARKNKNDCEDELARLRAAHASAAANAQTAATTLAAAQASLAAYQSDMDAAIAAMNRAQTQLEMVAAYRTIIFNEDGTGSERYAEAQAQVDRANDAAEDSQREFSRVRASHESRVAAVTAAQAAATAANAAAASALAALQAKERECLGLAAEDNAAQVALGAATTAAGAANAAAAAAATQAHMQAVTNLRTGLQAKRDRLRRCHDALRHRARILTRAFRALRDLGVINPNQVSAADIDIERHVATSIAQIVAEGAAQAVSLPTFEVFTILDGLQAAYGLVQIRQANLTPTAAGYRGDDYLSDWLEDHGHADNDAESREVINEMERFITHNGNTDYLRREWQRLSDDCARLQREIAEDEAKLARLEA